jgi:exoribonuclease R
MSLISLNSKFGEFIVREIEPELMSEISNEPSYQYFLQSPIKQDFIDRRFFRAQFTNWSEYESYPYCQLVEDLGPAYDELNYRKVVMIKEGINPEMYPKQAINECKKMAENFEYKILSELNFRSDWQDQLTFSIDGKGTQAVDDAITFEQLPDSLYKVTVHISDVAALVTPGSATNKEALSRAETTYVLKSFHMPMLPA